MKVMYKEWQIFKTLIALEALLIVCVCVCVRRIDVIDIQWRQGDLRHKKVNGETLSLSR